MIIIHNETKKVYVVKYPKFTLAALFLFIVIGIVLTLMAIFSFGTVASFVQLAAGIFFLQWGYNLYKAIKGSILKMLHS